MWVVFVAFARRNAFGAVFASLGMRGAGETIGFLRAWWCPPKRTEKVVINDGAVERIGQSGRTRQVKATLHG